MAIDGGIGAIAGPHLLGAEIPTPYSVNAHRKDFPFDFLGSRVNIRDAQIEGVVSSHERFLDGSERWCVDYWHNGERKSIRLEARELEVV